MTEGPGRGRRASRPSGDERERAILATAERLLGERPVADISIDDLARGAGISRSSFYFYFPSKEAVVLALLDRVAGAARDARNDALSGVGDDAAEIWRRALATIVATFRSHRPLMLAAAQMIGDSDELRKLWGEILEGFVADTTAAIEAERERGAALGGVPARHLAVVLVWMNERVLQASMSAQEPSLPEDDALEVLTQVWSRAIYGDDSLGSGGPSSPARP